MTLDIMCTDTTLHPFNSVLPGHPG